MQKTLYLELADQLYEQIKKGVYRSGDRLPSVREQSHRLGVSVSTILQAYGVLQDRRLIEAQPQSGYYISRPVQLPRPPATSAPEAHPTEVSISEMALEIVQSNERPGTVQLGTALPNIETPAIRRLHRSLATIARSNTRNRISYAFPPGNAELRLQIARRGVDAGFSLAPEEVVITNGCQEALVLALRAVAGAGDTVAIESPVFYGALQAIESLGLKTVEIPTDPNIGISLEALQMVLEQWPVKALVLIPNFSNPSGYCMPDTRKKALIELLARHDLPLIEDDIYADLGFSSSRPKAIKAWDQDGRVLLCSSISKTLDPGLRIGWVLPGRYRKQVQHLKLVTSMATATLPQLAVAAYLEHGGYDKHLRTVRSNYRRNRDLCMEAIARNFPAETRATHPEGGFLSWVELPAQCDSLSLYRQAMAQNITIAPGPLFSPTQKYRNFIRLNYGQAWDKRTELALCTLGELIGKLA